MADVVVSISDRQAYWSSDVPSGRKGLEKSSKAVTELSRWTGQYDAEFAGADLRAAVIIVLSSALHCLRSGEPLRESAGKNCRPASRRIRSRQPIHRLTTEEHP